MIGNAKDGKGDEAHQIEMGVYRTQHPGFRKDKEKNSQSDAYYQIGYSGENEAQCSLTQCISLLLS